MRKVSASTIITAAAFLFCVLDAFILARTLVLDSDLVQNFNELFSIFHGNVLLQHWILADDNFYLADLPFFVFMAALFGIKSWLIYTEPALVFSLLLLAAILLCIRARPAGSLSWGGALLLIFLIGLPFGKGLSLLLAPAIHSCTLMLSLWAVLSIQPVLSGARMNRWLFLPFFLLVFAATASDPMAQTFFTLPLSLLVVLRAWLRTGLRVDDLIMLCLVVAASVLGVLWPSFVAHHHGFIVVSAYTTNFVPGISVLLTDLDAIFSGWRILLNAQNAVLRGLVLHPLLAATRSVTMLLVILSCARILWRMPRAPEQGTAQFLVLAAVCHAAASVISASFSLAIGTGIGFPQAAIRYITPIYIFTSIAAVIEAQNLWRTSSRRIRLAAAAVFGVFLVIFLIPDVQTTARAAVNPPSIVTSPQFQMAAWLEAHHLTYGVSDYWSSGSVSAMSGHHVVVDPLIFNGKLVPFLWLIDCSNFMAHRRPQFAVYVPGNLFGISPLVIEQTYGRPSQTFNVNGSEVMVFPH